MDISSELDAKKAAISKYESQVTNGLYHTQRRPILTREFVSRFYNTEETFLLGSPASLRNLNRLLLILRLSLATVLIVLVKRIRYWL